MITKITEISSGRASAELEFQKELMALFRDNPLPPEEMLANLPIFMSRQHLARMLFFCELYSKIVEVNGSVVEFGCRYGHNSVLFNLLRSIYEPFNHHRKTIAFDTFEGFPHIGPKDGSSHYVQKGALAVAPGYENFLIRLLKTHESNAPVSHIKKFDVIKGDATHTFERYLQDNPHTMIALAYFDMDLYEPTKKCIELVMPRVTKGSILGFDELNYPTHPGETTAVMETVGLSKYRIVRSSFSTAQSYLVIE